LAAHYLPILGRKAWLWRGVLGAAVGGIIEEKFGMCGKLS
jgi:hypothetical protein